MSTAGGTKLRVIKGAQPAAKDIYAADKAKALDLDRWARVHIAGDRSEPLNIATPRDRERVERL